MASIGDVKATLTLDTAKFTAGISTAKKATDSLRNTMGSITSSIFNVKNAMVGLVGALGVNDIKNTAIQFESLQNAMNAASGGAKEGAASMAFIRSESDRLGLNLVSTADSFKSFLGAARTTKLTSEEIRNVFTSVSEASAVMGISAEQSSGAFMALQQMLSKGTVQAEELRGQLGERIPGAFEYAAQAMGVTTRELGKMLEQGQVVAEDFVPKFADVLRNQFAKDVPAAAASARASMERFGNSITDLKLVIAESGLLEFLTQLAKVATTGFKALGNTIKESLSTSMKDATASNNEYIDSLMTMVSVSGKIIGFVADQWLNLKIAISGAKVIVLEIAESIVGFAKTATKYLEYIVNSYIIGFRDIKKVVIWAFDSIKEYIKPIIDFIAIPIKFIFEQIKYLLNSIIDIFNTVIGYLNKLGAEVNKIGGFSFGVDFETQAKKIENSSKVAKKHFDDLLASPKPSKDIDDFTNKFVSNIGKVTEEAKKAEEAVKNIAPTTASASAPIFTFNTQQFEDTLKTGVQSALTKGITDALTGKFDFQTFAQQMTTAVASAAAAGIVQGMSLSTGGALALAGGAAVLGGMFGGGGGGKSSGPSSEDIFNKILGELEKQTSIMSLQGLEGTAASTEISSLADKIQDITALGNTIGLTADEINSMTTTQLKNAVFYWNETGDATEEQIQSVKDALSELGLSTNIGKSWEEAGASLSALSGLQEEYTNAVLENSQAFEKTGLGLADLSIALGNASLETTRVDNAFSRLGVSTKEEFTALINNAANAGEALADANTTWDDLTQIQKDSLVAATNFGEEIDILSDYFGVGADGVNGFTDSLKQMESSLNSVTSSIAAVGEMSRSTEQVIDTITAGMKAPAESVAFLQERRKQELAELETARANLAELTPGTETYLQQLVKVQQENQDFLTASQNAAEAVKNILGSSDVGTSEQQAILDDLRSQQEVNFTLEQQLMNEQISFLSKIEENTRPTGSSTPTTEGLTDEQIALVLQGLIEKYATQEAFD